MPQQLIENVGATGLIQDVDPKKLPDGAWSDGRNVRFDGFLAEKVGGSRTIFSSLSASAYSVFYYDTPNGTHHFVYAGETRVFVVSNASHYDVTRVNVSGTATLYATDLSKLWTGGTFGGLLFLNNETDQPQIQQSTSASAKLVNLPNWPTTLTTRCSCMRSFKNFLVALDITRGATRYRQTVLWSASADPLTVPASWQALTTNDSGEVALAETNGTVLDCLPLRDVNIVYKDDSIWGMQYTADNNVFRFYKIFNDVGLLAKRCVAAFESYHVFIGSDLDVYVHDGNTLRSIGQDRWAGWLRDNLSGSLFQRAFVVANPKTTEIWFGIPTGEEQYCSKFLLWNWRKDTWGIRDANNVSAGANGVIESPDYLLLWSTITDTWDSVDGTWTELATIPPDKALVLASPSRLAGLIETEFGTSEFNTALPFSLERQGLWAVITKPDKPIDLQSRKFIRRVRFRVQGSSASNITYSVAVQTDLGDSLTYTSTDASLNGTAEVVVLKRGRFLSLKVESTADVNIHLHAIEIELEEAGRYL